jgi:hypothetical protein
MKKFILPITLICLMTLVVMPAQAFTMHSLSIDVDPAGTAQVDLNYELTFFEQGAVFFKIADPASELQKAFDSGSSAKTTVISAGPSSARVLVPNFASVSTKDGVTIMTTPAVSFERAEKVLKNYWFAPLVAADFSPSVTMVTFPDGYQESFYNPGSIPSVKNAINR